jgi:hypothetical protein
MNTPEEVCLSRPSAEEKSFPDLIDEGRSFVNEEHVEFFPEKEAIRSGIHRRRINT